MVSTFCTYFIFFILFPSVAWFTQVNNIIRNGAKMRLKRQK